METASKPMERMEIMEREVSSVLLFTAVMDPARAQQSSDLDETLLLRVGQGDNEAFCQLYSQTKGSVYAYALSLLRDRQEAEDVMQDTYLKIRAAAHLYAPQGKPMAWIFTIAGNLCRMRLRQQKRVTVLAEEGAVADLGLDRVRDLGDRLVLEAAFRVLSPEECRIILLHAVSGFKHREIGQLLNLPLSTVLSKYSRGIKKLRRELEGSR